MKDLGSAWDAWHRWRWCRGFGSALVGVVPESPIPYLLTLWNFHYTHLVGRAKKPNYLVMRNHCIGIGPSGFKAKNGYDSRETISLGNGTKRISFHRWASTLTALPSDHSPSVRLTSLLKLGFTCLTGARPCPFLSWLVCYLKMLEADRTKFSIL